MLSGRCSSRFPLSRMNGSQHKAKRAALKAQEKKWSAPDAPDHNLYGGEVNVIYLTDAGE